MLYGHSGYKIYNSKKLLQAMNRYVINDVLDVKQVLNDIHELYPLEWHPNDNFVFYTKEEEMTRAFRNEKQDIFNQIMTECFQYCDDFDLDVYEVAGEVQAELWKKQRM